MPLSCQQIFRMLFFQVQCFLNRLYRQDQCGPALVQICLQRKGTEDINHDCCTDGFFSPIQQMQNLNFHIDQSLSGAIVAESSILLKRSFAYIIECKGVSDG